MRRAPRARRTAGALVATLAAAAVLGACSGTSADGQGASPAASGSSASASGPAAASPATLASPVEGVVLHVDSPQLGQVTDFTLLTGGRQVLFTMGTLEDPLDFPAAHLAEHVASSEPVRVYFKVDGSKLVVYRLEDASASQVPASPSAS